MGEIKELVNRLSDPRITWNVALSFAGQYKITQAITTTTPQLLYICDDIICHPTRFSSYYSWHDGTGQNLTRIFPNNQEAWDHTNETNPNTAPPYNGNAGVVVGYQGYFAFVDLTNGTYVGRVYISKRNYPQLQILIFNKATFNVVVNDPPSAFGLVKDTNGTAGSGNTTLAQNQYVVFYKTISPTIDTTKGVFAVGPIGASKIYTNELYINHISPNTILGFNLYLGIRSNKDMHVDRGVWTSLESYSGASNGYNISGLRNTGGGIIYNDSDPTSSTATYPEGIVSNYIATGWAEDDSGNVKYIIRQEQNEKYSLQWNDRAYLKFLALYDVDADEWYSIKTINPLVNVDSYGQAKNSIYPLTFEAVYNWFGFLQEDPGASVSYGIDPSDNVVPWANPSNTTWTFNDAYALANCFSTPESVCLATSALAIYTDDTSVSIPSDPRQAFAVGGSINDVARFGLQVKPFMDITLYANKTYAVITRIKRFPGNMSGIDLKNWATKKYPKALSQSEWGSLLSVLPLNSNLAGSIIVSGNYTVSAPTTAPAGTSITVSGSTPRTNANVYVALVDPDTYSVVSSAGGTTDGSGNYSLILNIPSNATIGKTYKIFVVVG